MTIERLVSGMAVGDERWILAGDLGLDPEAFHALVADLKNKGGGRGFVIVTSHEEAASGERLYDMLRIHRVT